MLLTQSQKTKSSANTDTRKQTITDTQMAKERGSAGLAYLKEEKKKPVANRANHKKCCAHFLKNCIQLV